MKKYFTPLLIGFTAGFIGGLTGLGGGVIMVPLLTWLLHLSQHEAHGTSLTAIFFTGLVGAFTYYEFGNIEMKIVLPLAVSSIFAGMLGAFSISYIKRKALRKIFGSFLIFVAALLMLSSSRSELMSTTVISIKTIFLFFLLGLGVGFSSGMLGIGGGSLMIPSLVFLFGLSQQEAHGVSLAVMIPTALAGSIVHFKERRVNLKMAPFLWISIILGVPLGAIIANSIEERSLRIIFIIIITLIGIKYILE